MTKIPMPSLNVSQWVGIIAIVLAPVSTSAAVTEPQWAQLNHNLVQQHVLPRYQTLRDEAATLQASTTQLCQTLDGEQLEQAQTAFKDTMAAWQGVQHIKFGPIELLMRSYSLQFWPDKKNLTSKQLNKLLAEQNPKSLESDFLHTASIAVKGLPAVERLLFSAESLENLRASKFRCDFLVAISGYIAETSHNTHLEWQSFQQEVSEVNDDGLYTRHKEASVDLMKAQVEPLEVILDLKLMRPLGKAKAKPKRLESWRSGQSLQNIQHNLQSLQHMYNGVEGLNLQQLLRQEGLEQRSAVIEQLFASLLQRLTALPTPLAAHMGEAQTRAELEKVITELSELHDHLGKGMTKLSLQLGFNSRDGD